MWTEDFSIHEDAWKKFVAVADVLDKLGLIQTKADHWGFFTIGDMWRHFKRWHNNEFLVKRATLIEMFQRYEDFKAVEPEEYKLTLDECADFEYGDFIARHPQTPPHQSVQAQELVDLKDKCRCPSSFLVDSS